MGGIQSMLSADSASGRVTIGRNALGEIRALSNARELRCPSCGEAVVLKAGSLVASHFAHLAGSVCSRPGSEPETTAHRVGKALLADWAQAVLPGSAVAVEADILETGQRADVLIKTNGRRIALEYQCAEIAGREWLRRHRLYRSAGICDLWILGADRMNRAGDGINPGEIGSTLLQFGAPLLFLDAEGARFPCGTIARFRPRGGKSRGFRAGRFVTRPILELPFPYNLLDWPHKVARGAPPPVTALPGPTGPGTIRGDFKLAQWLEARYHVKSDSLPPFFGLSVSGQEVFACNPRLWQAAIYYRFVENRCGQDWWLGEVETWVRRYVPLAIPSADLLRRALHGYQGILSAAGLLSMPHGKGNARVEADFHSLDRIPDGEAAARLAAYRRALLWERK